MHHAIHLFAGACALSLFLCDACAQGLETPRLGDIRAQQLQIRGDVQAGTGAYKDMPKDQREQLLAKPSELLDLIGARQSLDDLSETEKTDAFNSLQWIKAALTKAEDERVVCERRRPVGSNRVQRVCGTVAERRKAREQAVDAVDRRSLCNGEELCTND